MWRVGEWKATARYIDASQGGGGGLSMLGFEVEASCVHSAGDRLASWGQRGQTLSNNSLQSYNDGGG